VVGVCGASLVRVTESEEQRPGSVFSPIHWSGQYSARARVGALIPAVADAISGQPEFKQAPVAVEPYAAGWYGFVLTREPIDCTGSEYWTRVRGKACWRHELAGPEAECPWPDRLSGRFGGGDWIVMRDSAHNRYRMALMRGDRVEVVAFFDRDFDALPPRHWLEALFEKDTLDAAERTALLMGRPSQAVPDSGAIVCACFGVGKNDLVKAIAAGAGSVEQLGIRLKAGTNCGSCVPELRKLLAGAPR
jgi:assimilatory nitrate reductase catalytic subunit